MNTSAFVWPKSPPFVNCVNHRANARFRKVRNVGMFD
jgi:hypothetical protein